MRPSPLLLVVSLLLVVRFQRAHASRSLSGLKDLRERDIEADGIDDDGDDLIFPSSCNSTCESWVSNLQVCMEIPTTETTQVINCLCIADSAYYQNSCYYCITGLPTDQVNVTERTRTTTLMDQIDQTCQFLEASVASVDDGFTGVQTGSSLSSSITTPSKYTTDIVTLSNSAQTTSPPAVQGVGQGTYSCFSTSSTSGDSVYGQGGCAYVYGNGGEVGSASAFVAPLSSSSGAATSRSSAGQASTTSQTKAGDASHSRIAFGVSLTTLIAFTLVAPL